MKRFGTAIGLFFLLWMPNGFSQEVLSTSKSDKVSDAASYSIGLDIGRNLKGDGFEAIDLKLADLILGLQDGLAGAEARVPEAEIAAAIDTIRKRLETRMMERARRNADEGKSFLAENKKKEGVITLPSGLQYKVLKSGSGAQPTLTSTVKVHYEGKLINGKVFDSSIERGEPAQFQVTRVISGWTEALQRMRVGDKWEVYIPSELAYAERGAGPDIGPNSTLIFQVELLEVK